MELKEITQAVEDLEPRIDRLRALYEQYFMGLEKLQPTTLRREVDRKFWQLRKIRIQNTRLRFRLQMLIQRYNTYQQYWGRVLREMDRGTYRRDVLRAAKRVGNQEALTIVGRRRAKMFKELAGAHSDDEAAETPRVWELPTEEETEAATLVPSAGGPEQAGAPAASLEDPSQWNLFDEPTADREAALTTPSPVGRKAAAPADEPPTLDSRLRDVDDEAPTVPPEPAVHHQGMVRRAPPAKPASTPAAEPPRGPEAPTARPPRPPPPRQSSSGRPPKAGKSPPPPRPGSSRKPPPARAIPPPPAAKPKDAMRAVYEEYVTAKRGAKEATEGLTYEKVRKSLEGQRKRLREKHGDRNIEFEVVERDGRTMIRPVIK